MNKKIIPIIIGVIAVIILVSIMIQNPSESGWTNKDGGYEEPYSDSIELIPSQEDVAFVMTKTDSTENEAILALIELDHDTQKAIEYLNNKLR